MFIVKQNIFIKLFPVFLFVLSFITRFVFIEHQDISHDEPFSIYHAQFEIQNLISILTNFNNPPLFEIILHYWIKFFGIGTIATRLLTVFFSSTACVALFFLGKKHFSINTGIMSSTLLTFSSLAIFHAQDVRVYSLFLFFTICSVYFYLSLLEGKSSAQIIAYAFSSLVLIYLHYFGFIVLFVQAVHLILFNRARIKLFIVPNALIVLLYTPQFITLFSNFNASAKNGTWISPPDGLESLYNMLWSFSNMPVITIGFILILLGGVLYIFFKRTRFRAKINVVFIAMWFFIPFIGMFVVSYKIPMYISRYLIFVLPSYYLLISFTLEKIVKAKSVYVLISVLLLSSFAFTAEYMPDKKRNIKQVVDLIKLVKDDGTLVIVCPYEAILPFTYHYDLEIFKDVSDQKEYNLVIEKLSKDNVFLINDVNLVKPKITNRFQKIIYLSAESNFAAPNNGIDEYLNANKKQIYRKSFGDNFTLFYYLN